jgi:dihydroxyacetone kinase DhaKLM complex PTS-EIIA-like component DhaM
MVGQVAGDDVPVATAGGTEDGRLGTSAPRIADAIRSTFERGAEATLVLLDLGSAALSLELALEEKSESARQRTIKVNLFRRTYNALRPHQALDERTRAAYLAVEHCD